MINHSLSFRYALQPDSNTIAHFMIEASGGIVDFLFSNTPSIGSVISYMEKRVSSEDSPISYKNTYLCEKDNEVIGAVTSYFGSRFLIPDRSKVAIPDEVYECVCPYYEVDLSGTFYLDTLFVSSKYRRDGIATVLLNHSIDIAIGNSFKIISLYVFEDNHGAVNLYQKFGFYIEKRIHIKPCVNFAPGARLLMYKLL